MKKVAIQGGLGSYHDIAAHQYFDNEEIELVCCTDFEDIFETIQHDNSVFGMLAIENTIAGSLLYNNELLRQSNTQIIGEYKLRISHCFVCLPDDDWEDIREVNSHPIALMQCREFLSQHPQYKAVECEDTARSAQLIKEKNLHGQAAICSEAAANLFGMKILATEHRDQQAQLHPLPRRRRQLAGGQLPQGEVATSEVEHGLHPSSQRRKPLAGALHPLVL
jgi:prephenate dehydratase